MKNSCIILKVFLDCIRKNILVSLFLIGMVLNACVSGTERRFVYKEKYTVIRPGSSDNHELMNDFAKALSNVVYQNKKVR